MRIPNSPYDLNPVMYVHPVWVLLARGELSENFQEKIMTSDNDENGHAVGKPRDTEKNVDKVADSAEKTDVTALVEKMMVQMRGFEERLDQMDVPNSAEEVLDSDSSASMVVRRRRKVELAFPGLLTRRLFLTPNCRVALTNHVHWFVDVFISLTLIC